MTFTPILRSGSCSEIGPKRYMEDEHICIDNILESIDIAEHFASPGGFYGVCKSVKASAFLSFFSSS